MDSSGAQVAVIKSLCDHHNGDAMHGAVVVRRQTVDCVQRLLRGRVGYGEVIGACPGSACTCAIQRRTAG